MSDQQADVNAGVGTRRVVIVATGVIGTFMAAMDSTVMNISVPVLKETFAANLSAIQWVVTAYSLTMAAFVPVTAFLANRFGRKAPLVAALGLFTLGSLLCALSPSLGALIGGRVIQGIGGSALVALGMMVVLSAFPQNRRGAAMAWYGIPVMIAPALGPIVGGYLISTLGWHSVFLINVPVGAVGIGMAITSLRRDRRPSGTKSSFDLIGFLLISLASVGITYALSESAVVGWDRIETAGIAAAGVGLFAAFIVRALGSKEPLLELRLFRYRSFWSGGIALMASLFTMFGPLLLVPLYLQTVRDLSPFQAGLLMTWNAVGAMVSMFVGGRLVDRFGAKVVVIPGLTIFALDTLAFASIGANTSWLALGALLFFRGIGTGLTNQPLGVACLADVTGRKEIAHTATLISVMRQLIGGAGVAVITSYVQSRARDYHILGAGAALTAGIDDSFWLCFWLLAAAVLVVIVVLPKRKWPEALQN